MTHSEHSPWRPLPSRGTSPLAIELRHRRERGDLQPHWRPRSGVRHDDGPLCPIERQRTHRVARAFCIAGTFLAVALMISHMAGLGL